MHGLAVPCEQPRAYLSYMDPSDLAATVAHLAGLGGRNITGTEITVDAGANA